LPPSSPASFPFKRIVVIGVTGSGKSILAERLAQKLDLEYIELDALYWKPGWVETDREEFRQKVAQATSAPAWALAGNYSFARDLIWPRAEALVWLDYSFLLVFSRLIRRTLRRWLTQEPLWGTNTERLWPQLKIWSKDSLFFWQVHSFRKHKRLYPQLIASSGYSHLKVFHFKKPGETDTWLESLI
jgi:hypothetical protein